jgi:hypothetical protein
MSKLALFIAIWVIGIFAILALKHWLAEPDFDQIIEQTPTAAGEQRPKYFK